MIKYFSKAFKITNENIILTTPLVFFLFLLSIYLGVAQNAPDNVASSILLLVTILFMLAAFFAGWLYMVKKAIELDQREFIMDEDRSKESFSLLKDVPMGVGEYFLPFIGTLILYVILSTVLFVVAYKLGLHFIGKMGLSIAQIKVAMESPIAMKSLVSSLSVAELTKLNSWNLLFLSTIALLSFVTMFWAPEIIMNTKNPFIAFFKALAFTIRNLLPSIILFIYLSFINFTISLINALSTINPILYFISMLIYFYFVVYVVVLVFLYYEQENHPKPQISAQTKDAVENSCGCGPDSDGQEQSGDSDSEGN